MPKRQMQPIALLLHASPPKHTLRLATCYIFVLRSDGAEWAALSDAGVQSYVHRHAQTMLPWLWNRDPQSQM